MSITQGGYGIHPAVYQYMITGSYLNLDLALNDVPDAAVHCLIEQVYMYTFIMLALPNVIVYKCKNHSIWM